MNQVFDFKRIMLLARLKFSLHKKVLFLSVMGYFALLFIIGFLIAYANRNNSEAASMFTLFHYIALPIMMGLGGILLAGRSFQDMNTAEKSTVQILMPASTLEKYSLHLVATSLLWLVFSFISYIVFSLLFNGIWALLFGFEFIAFTASEMFDLKMISEILLGFFLLHSAFLLGAAAFKKHPIVKTILAQFILQWGYSLLGLLVILVFFGSMENFGLKMESLDNLSPDEKWSISFEELEYRARLILRILTVLLTVALYVTGYYKLKEREV